MKTYSLKNDPAPLEIKYTVYQNVFDLMYYTTLIGGEFANCHGQGRTIKHAVDSLKIRVYQLRGKKLNSSH